MNDNELIKCLISLWHAEKKWAEELFIKVFFLKEAREIVDTKHRGEKRIPGTNFRSI